MIGKQKFSTRKPAFSKVFKTTIWFVREFTTRCAVAIWSIGCDVTRARPLCGGFIIARVHRLALPLLLGLRS